MTACQPEAPSSLDRGALIAAGLYYHDGGLSIIPVNSRKKPAITEWGPYQKKQATREQIEKWACLPSVAGFAAVCGKISGGLVIEDFDVAGFFERFIEAVKRDPEVRELAGSLPIQQTGSGNHQMAFRCGLPLRNDNLAYSPADNKEGREIAIETRGEGGYAVLPPSFCHLAEKRGVKHKQAYKVLQGDFAKIPSITNEQAQRLIEVARSLCQAPVSKKQMRSAPLSPRSNCGAVGGGVIGRFNQVYGVGTILSRNNYLARGNRHLAPDSTTGEPGVHIFPDTGRCYSHHGNDPLNDGHAHDPFSVFCILEHGGDVMAAVKAAAAEVGIERTHDRPQEGAGTEDQDQDHDHDHDRAEREAIPEEAPESSTKGTYSGQIAQLNEKHAIAMIGGKCVVLNMGKDHNGKHDITFSSVNDFKNFQANQKISVDTPKGPLFLPVAKVWLESPDRRQYPGGVVFSPGQDTPGAYNLWRGFAVASAPGDWSLYREHMLMNICAGNEAHFNYLFDWMARNVQDPGGERPGVAVVLKSVDFGTGKGVFSTQYGRIFGVHFQHIVNGTQLVGKFNSHLKACALCFVDEGVWGGDRQAAGVLRGLITEKKMMIEPKGVNAFSVDNHMSFIIASNNNWVIPAGFDERRFFVLDVAPTRKQDTEYFGALVAQMDQGGREAMLYDLLERKITMDLRLSPRTAALLDQVVHGMTTVQKFWFERLRGGDEYRWPDFVLTDHLYQDYLGFATACGDRHKLIDRQFGKELRRMCPPIKRVRKTIGEERPWVYSMEKLDICRTLFEKAVGVKVDWDPEKDETDVP